jgi:hypothetical protein
MNLSGHEDRHTLQRHLKPSKEGTHRRLDENPPGHPAQTSSPPASRTTDRQIGGIRTDHLERGDQALFSQRLLPGCLLASVGDVFAYCGDRFSGEAFEYIPLVAGQDEGADAVLDGHLGSASGQKSCPKPSGSQGEVQGTAVVSICVVVRPLK